MEKMQSPLSSIVTELMKSSKSSSTIAFGPVAVQLLKCVQAIQENKHIVVDIKPENFMLSSDAGKGSGTAAKLASRIRILDLALVKMWASIGSHRANEGTSTLEGTPLFASLNVHNGETPSRRDDLEALGYVIAELIMKLASGNPAMELPWSNGRSDEEIGKIKAAQVENANSEFYKQLGSPAVAKTMKEFLDTVREYSYKKTPDCEQLASLLSKLNVTIKKVLTPKKTSKVASKTTPKATTPASGPRTPSTVAGTKRVTRSRARTQEESDEEESSPHKIARDEHYMETEDTDSITDAQPFAAARPAHKLEEEGMDWEPTASDENQDPEPDQKPKAMVGLTIVVDGGPDKGTAVNLIQGRCETLIVGRNPVAQRGGATLALTRDGDVDDSHIQINLSISKKLQAIVVTDLKSSSGAFVGNDRIKKTSKIFRGQTVRIGNSVLIVKTLDGGKVADASQGGKTVGSNRAATLKRPGPQQTEVIEIEDVSPQPALKRRGMRLRVVEGPHTGEEYELEFGVSESLNIGSKPSGKAGTKNVSLHKDKSLKPNHVHIELLNHKKFKAVVVTDKSQGDLKVNRDKVKNKTQAFVSDRIEMGNSVLHVQSL